MSGGSHNYISYKVEEYCVGEMYDAELNDLMKDLVPVLHDREWWQSGDISEEGYRKTVVEFKQKWFQKCRTERLQNYVDESINNLRNELYALVGVEENKK